MSEPGREHLVEAGDAGERVDRWLARVEGTSRSAAAKAVGAGRVTIDGRDVAASRRVAAGELVRVAPPPPEAPVPPPPVPPVRYEDDHLLVVAKPPGLVVHPGIGHRGDTLVDALRASGRPLADAGDPRRPGVVHRLDRDTSGLLVVAKTLQAHEGLVAQLRARTVGRRYLALTDLLPPAERGRVDAPLARHPRHRQRFAVVADGKHAVTRWTTLAAGAAPGGREVGLVGCRLQTGRTHQIRVHLEHLGCPVVGDQVYGRSRDARDELGLGRPALHAAVLAFDHPATRRAVTFVEPPPDDLAGAIATVAWREPTEEPMAAFLDAG